MAILKTQTRLRWQLLQFAAVVLILGLSQGVIWAKAAQRPGYTLSEELVVGISERGLADVFSSDALFSVLAMISGLVIGVMAWVWFRDRGWWVSIMAVLGAFASSLVTWQIGVAVEPPSFDERLAAAVAGDVVQVDLVLHSASAMLVGPFFAITPVMLLAAFWPERPSKEPLQQLPRRVATVD